MSVFLPTVGAFIANLLLGAGLLLGVFKLMERRLRLGASTGIVVGTGVIYAQATLGERWLSVTVSEMKLLVIIACLGAVVGVVGTVLTVKPDL